MACSREIVLVAPCAPGENKGRRPAKAASTSERDGRRRQVPARGLENELDLALGGLRVPGGTVHGNIGRADDQSAVPWNAEQDAAIRSLRNHQPALAGHEAPVEDDVRSAADRHQRRGLFISEASNRVDPHARRVEYRPGVKLELFARFIVHRHDAPDAIAIGFDLLDAHVVQHRRAQADGGAHQRNGQAGIVELPVPVGDAALQPLGPHTGQLPVRARGRQPLRRADPPPPRQGVVHPQSDAHELALEDPVARNDELERVHELGRVGKQQRALRQRFAHEFHVALREITDAAVDELGAAARRSTGEITRFDQRRAVAARRGIHRDAESGGAAADHEHVPRACVAQLPEQMAPLDHAGAVHDAHLLERSTARRHWSTIASRRSPLIDGSNRRSALQSAAISSVPDQKPVASPAR